MKHELRIPVPRAPRREALEAVVFGGIEARSAIAAALVPTYVEESLRHPLAGASHEPLVHPEHPSETGSKWASHRLTVYVTLRAVTINGLYVDDRAGSAAVPVVLVHGAPDRSKNFAPVVELLSDLPLVIYDRRGYGKSIDTVPPAKDFADHAQDLIAILDGRRAVVVAQSVGCNVAMAAAAKAPSLFAALGMWEPPTAWCDWWPVPDLRESVCSLVAATDTELLAEVFNRNILGDGRWESLNDRTKDMLRHEGAAFHADMASELISPFDFADITCPVIIGAGTATGSGHLEGARRLARILNAGVFEVEHADHFAPLTSPASWAELVRKAVALANAAE